MTDALVIDAEGLDRLSCNAKSDPSTGRKTLKAKAVCESGWHRQPHTGQDREKGVLRACATGTQDCGGGAG
jgi:hypothetical protein